MKRHIIGITAGFLGIAVATSLALVYNDTQKNRPIDPTEGMYASDEVSTFDLDQMDPTVDPTKRKVERLTKTIEQIDSVNIVEIVTDLSSDTGTKVEIYLTPSSPSGIPDKQIVGIRSLVKDYYADLSESEIEVYLNSDPV